LRITNSFFGAAGPSTGQVFFSVPNNGYVHVGYTVAEFDAARSAVKNAFNYAGWDGEGALPVGDETRVNAIGALNHFENLTSAPEVTPNPNGTLSLEWETHQGFGLLEIGRTRFSLYLQPSNGTPVMTSGGVDDISPALGRFVDVVLYPKPSHSLTLTSR
jgi:hypothetical protein